MHCDFVMTVYNIDENLTPVLLLAMRTCFMSHLLVLMLILVSKELVLVSVSVLILLILATTLNLTLRSIWGGLQRPTRR